MGKHERKDVQIAENIVKDLVNGNKIDSHQKQHKLYELSTDLAERIKRDFPDLSYCETVGNTYGNLGDLKLDIQGRDCIYIELKFLSGGRGTRANIGQNTLTDFDLFESKAKSWQEFRKEENHITWVKRELNKFEDYPENIKNTSGKKTIIYKKAGYLKDVIGTRRGKETKKVAKNVLNDPKSSQKKKKAAEIIINIVDKAEKEKKDYLNYLSELDQNHENIKKFLFLILSGRHTTKKLDEKWDLDLSTILDNLKNDYYVYYGYKNRKNKTVEVEDTSEKLKELLDKRIFISFKKGQTNVLISFKNDSQKEIPILRVVFHWKNKFQGIQTPCLNVFDSTYLK